MASEAILVPTEDESPSTQMVFDDGADLAAFIGSDGTRWAAISLSDGRDVYLEFTDSGLPVFALVDGLAFLFGAHTGTRRYRQGPNHTFAEAG